MKGTVAQSSRRDGVWRLLFYAALAGFAFLMVIPPQSVPDPMPNTLSDKAHHAISFVVLMVLAAMAYPRRSPLLLALLLVAFGGVMEMVQGSTNLGRQASWGDLVADAAGVGLALILLTGIRYWRRTSSNERHLQ